MMNNSDLIQEILDSIHLTVQQYFEDRQWKLVRGIMADIEKILKDVLNDDSMPVTKNDDDNYVIEEIMAISNRMDNIECVQGNISQQIHNLKEIEMPIILDILCNLRDIPKRIEILEKKES